jgi:ABC-2 type transport system ATP-binding protein
MNIAPVILTEGLTRRFDEITAVDSLDIAVYPGEVLGFLGHNGAGKTTTVRLLNGVLAPTKGRMRVLGLDPSLDGAELRRRTGVLTETPSVDERLTGYENLAIFAALYNVPPEVVKDRVAELLALFQLADRAGDRVGEYSKGMKQKLALARALVHQPEVLFLDEPTSGLDPVITRQVHDLIRELSRDGAHTVFLCTHNLAEAQRLCDRVAVLENGKLVALGSPNELARELWKGIHLEVETSHEALNAAIQVLGQMPDVREVAQVMDQPVVTLSLTQRNQVPTLVAHLVDQGIPLYRLVPKDPTLEDIYFALHEDYKAVAE